MGKPLTALQEAYRDDGADPERWQLGPLLSGSHVFSTMPTQLVDAPGHAAKIEIHGDHCDKIGKRIVEMMNGTMEDLGDG